MNERYIADRLLRFYNKYSTRISGAYQEDKILDELDRRMAPRIDALRETHRLSESDLKLRVNAVC